MGFIYHDSGLLMTLMSNLPCLGLFPILQSFSDKTKSIWAFLSLPALILGSLSPDLFYSMMWYSAATTAHDLIGWLYTGLPLCLLITIFVQKVFFSTMQCHFP
ncbi:DUF4184 family protein [Providencia rettgeri]|nr:DUF4184 family protein [Providencia rettgeri]